MRHALKYVRLWKALAHRKYEMRARTDEFQASLRGRTIGPMASDIVAKTPKMQ